MESILESIPQILTILSTGCGVVITALVASMVIWTYHDMRSRSRDILATILATLMVAILPIIGFIVYLMIRPKETLADAYERSLEQEALLQAIEEPEICPGCGQRLKHTYLFCPTCHTKIKRACPQCQKPLDLSWSMCPYCGASVTPQVLEPVKAPQESTEEATES